MLHDYLHPVNPQIIIQSHTNNPKQWGQLLHIYTPEETFPDLSLVRVAIVGVSAVANENKDYAAANAVRKCLYQLYNWQPDMVAADIGNVKHGKEASDVYFALQAVVSNLLQQHIIPIIIGDLHNLSYGQFLGHAEVGRGFNAVMFDQTMDLFTHVNPLHHRAFLYKTLSQQPQLKHFTHMGYQRYLVAPQMLDTLEKLHFECYSLGEIRQDITNVEPILRSAHLLSFDMSAVRAADAMGVFGAITPHGFFGEEACRIARYAGVSDTMTSFGLYQYDPEKDVDSRTAQLMAHMIWYFVDGYYSRRIDSPTDTDNVTTYTVALEGVDHSLIFVKSRKTDRWWMQVPNNQAEIGYTWIPCAYSDYQTALKNDIPERWMQAFLRLGN